MRLRAAVGCALLAAACGSPTEGDDAGPRVDAGFFVYDAGTMMDGGVLDAGAEVDAGVDAGLLDAGLPVIDAGFSVIAYPSGRTQSPLTAEVATHLQSIAALSPSKNANVFSKIGDSNTVATTYFACFAGAQVDLGMHTSLQPALTHFLGGTRSIAPASPPPWAGARSLPSAARPRPCNRSSTPCSPATPP